MNMITIPSYRIRRKYCCTRIIIDLHNANYIHPIQGQPYYKPFAFASRYREI
jgi:hypothetical protein